MLLKAQDLCFNLLYFKDTLTSVKSVCFFLYPIALQSLPADIHLSYEIMVTKDTTETICRKKKKKKKKLTMSQKGPGDVFLLWEFELTYGSKISKL